MCVICVYVTLIVFNWHNSAKILFERVSLLSLSSCIWYITFQPNESGKFEIGSTNVALVWMDGKSFMPWFLQAKKRKALFDTIINDMLVGFYLHLSNLVRIFKRFIMPWHTPALFPKKSCPWNIFRTIKIGVHNT